MLYVICLSYICLEDVDKKKVTTKQGKDLARKYNCPFVEVSAVRTVPLSIHSLNPFVLIYS